MRIYQLRSVLGSTALVILLWYFWPRKLNRNQRLQKQYQNIVRKINIKSEEYNKHYEYDVLRSSYSFSAPSKSFSSSLKNLSKEDLPKPKTEPPPRVNITSEEIATEVGEFLAENKLRKDKIFEECKNFISESKTGFRRIIAKTVQSRSPRAQMFTIDPRRSFAWCRTPKVATTTWARIMLQLYGIKKFGHYHSQMKSTERRFVSHWNKKKFVSSLVNKQRKYTGMLLARHPIDRLFSAFRDKIVRKSIIVRNLNKGNKKPTFSKFLTYLAMNSPVTYNRHWKPNWVLCNPCRYKYDYIVKMETFNRDSGSVLRQIGAADLADINHLNGRGKSNRTSLNYEILLKNVQPHILAKILDIYHLDFSMFGYDLVDLEDILTKKKAALVTDLPV